MRCDRERRERERDGREQVSKSQGVPQFAAMQLDIYIDKDADSGGILKRIIGKCNKASSAASDSLGFMGRVGALGKDQKSGNTCADHLFGASGCIVSVCVFF